MKAQCVMCGRDIASGILCDKCDRPKRSSSKGAAAAALHPEEISIPEHVLPEVAPDPFPKAPIVPFPIESTSLALTSLVELLAAIEVPSILLGSDQSVKFISEGARRLLSLGENSSPSARALELALGISLPENKTSYSTPLVVGDSTVELSSIPLAGGASGSVILLKPSAGGDVDAALLAFIRETLLSPLEALRAALASAQAKGTKEPVLLDAIGTIDQVLSSLELSPHLDGVVAKKLTAPALTEVLLRTAAKFEKEAAAKGVRIQIDAPETTETFREADELSRVLGDLLENSLHYVPQNGQVVLGLRFLEHKGKPLVLFFVMDNGPVVPEEFREAIFNPGFMWDPHDSTRTGKNLARARNFAVQHGGQIWMESKTGKACTFFLRVRPDGQ